MPEPERGAVLKSQHSQIKSYVLFRNYTDRLLDVIWVGFSGEHVHYGTLKPTECKMMNTYATHPWIFRDPDTGERMHVQGQSVYMPQPYQRGQRNRFLVPIRFPVRSLRHNALWAISQLISREEDVPQLELPRCLIHDIQDLRQCTAKAQEFKRSLQQQDEDEEAEEEAAAPPDGP